jgi:hypothetical protein
MCIRWARMYTHVFFIFILYARTHTCTHMHTHIHKYAHTHVRAKHTYKNAQVPAQNVPQLSVVSAPVDSIPSYIDTEALQQFMASQQHRALRTIVIITDYNQQVQLRAPRRETHINTCRINVLKKSRTYMNTCRINVLLSCYNIVWCYKHECIHTSHMHTHCIRIIFLMWIISKIQWAPTTVEKATTTLLIAPTTVKKAPMTLLMAPTTLANACTEAVRICMHAWVVWARECACDTCI